MPHGDPSLVGVNASLDTADDIVEFSSFSPKDSTGSPEKTTTLSINPRLELTATNTDESFLDSSSITSETLSLSPTPLESPQSSGELTEMFFSISMEPDKLVEAKTDEKIDNQGAGKKTEKEDEEETEEKREDTDKETENEQKIENEEAKDEVIHLPADNFYKDRKLRHQEFYDLNTISKDKPWHGETAVKKLKQPVEKQEEENKLELPTKKLRPAKRTQNDERLFASPPFTSEHSSPSQSSNESTAAVKKLEQPVEQQKEENKSITASRRAIGKTASEIKKEILKRYLKEQEKTDTEMYWVVRKRNELDQQLDDSCCFSFFTNRKAVKLQFLNELISIADKNRQEKIAFVRYKFRTVSNAHTLGDVKEIVNNLVAKYIVANKWETVKAGRNSETLSLLVNLGYDQQEVDRLVQTIQRKSMQKKG